MDVQGHIRTEAVEVLEPIQGHRKGGEEPAGNRRRRQPVVCESLDAGSGDSSSPSTRLATGEEFYDQHGCQSGRGERYL